MFFSCYREKTLWSCCIMVIGPINVVCQWWSGMKVETKRVCLLSASPSKTEIVYKIEWRLNPSELCKYLL